ncbi:MAG: hypothetical protein AAFY71_27410, partial [Bacteroidota bacterium]
VERNLNMMQRQFAAKKEAYNLLIKREIESEIQLASTITLHQVLHSAAKLQSPIFGRRLLIVGVFIFLGLSLGFFIIFLRQFFVRRVYSVSQLKSLKGRIFFQFTQPFRDEEPKIDKEIGDLAVRIQLDDQPRFIPISSCDRNYEKDNFTRSLGNHLTQLGSSVLLLTYNQREKNQRAYPTRWNTLAKKARDGKLQEVCLESLVKKTQPLLIYQELKKHLPALLNAYDQVLLSLPELEENLAHYTMFSEGKLNLLIVRESISELDQLERIDKRLDEMGLEAVRYLYFSTPWYQLGNTDSLKRKLKFIERKLRTIKK